MVTRQRCITAVKHPSARHRTVVCRKTTQIAEVSEPRNDVHSLLNLL